MKVLKKIILLSILIIFSTGCAAEYNITINTDGTFSETLDLTNLTEDKFVGTTFRETLNELKTNMSDVYTIDTPNYSNTHIKITRKKTSMKFLYTSEILTAYTTTGQYIHDEITITPSYENLIEEFYTKADEEDVSTGLIITVNIDIPYKVIETNADRVVGTKHTWTYTANNLDKKLILKYDSDYKYKTPEQEKKTDIITIIAVVFIVILIICFIVYTIYKLKNKNKDFK